MPLRLPSPRHICSTRVIDTIRLQRGHFPGRGGLGETRHNTTRHDTTQHNTHTRFVLESSLSASWLSKGSCISDLWALGWFCPPDMWNPVSKACTLWDHQGSPRGAFSPASPPHSAPRTPSLPGVLASENICMLNSSLHAKILLHPLYR